MVWLRDTSTSVSKVWKSKEGGMMHGEVDHYALHAVDVDDNVS